MSLIKRPRRIFYKKNKIYIIIHGKKKLLRSNEPGYIKKILKRFMKKGKKKITKNIRKKKKQINKFLTGEIQGKISAGNFIENQINKDLIQSMNDKININNKNDIILPIEDKKYDEIIEYKPDEMNVNEIDKFLINVGNRINNIRDVGMKKIDEIENEKNKILEINEKKINEIKNKKKLSKLKLKNIENELLEKNEIVENKNKEIENISNELFEQEKIYKGTLEKYNKIKDKLETEVEKKITINKMKDAMKAYNINKGAGK